METILNAGQNPYEANSAGRKRRSLLSLYIGVVGTITISMTASMMLPVAAEEIGGSDIWSMGLSLGSILSIVCMPLFGYLSARRPHISRPLFGAALIISASCIFLRAIAPSMWVIVIPTLFLTLYSPALNVLGYTMVRNMYGAVKGASYLGLVVTMQGIGMLVGPAIGGFMIQNMGWRSINFLIFPMLLVSALLMLSGARITKEEGKQIATSKGKFDYPGAIAVSVFLAALIVMLSMTSYMPWGSIPNITLICIAVIALICLAQIIRKKGLDAFIPAPVLKDSNTRLLFGINFFTTFNAIGLSGFLASYMMYVMMRESSEAGIAITMFSVASLFMGPVIGRIIGKAGNARTTVILGGGILRCAVQVAMLFFVVMNPGVSIYVVYVIMFIGGFYGAVGGTVPAVAPQVQLREDIRPLGNSIVQLGANFGSTVGICVYTAVINAIGMEQGFSVILTIAAVAAIGVLLFALPLKKLQVMEVDKADV